MITETIEWVPVEERMPGLGQAVLVRVSATGTKHGHAFTLGHVSCGGWYGGEAGDELYAVTHWAEIKGPSAAEADPSVIRLTSSLGMLVVYMAWAEKMPAGKERDEIIRMYRGRMASLCEVLDGLL